MLYIEIYPEIFIALIELILVTSTSYIILFFICILHFTPLAFLWQGTEEIESIALDWPNPEDVEGTMLKTKRSAWNRGVLSKMSRLRLLRIRNACFDSGPEYLSNELWFLEWHNYPSKSLPSCFQPENLVEVHMCYSNLRQLWLGNKVTSSI